MNSDKLESEWGTLDNMGFINPSDDMVCEECYKLNESKMSLPSFHDEHICCWLDLPECDHIKSKWNDIKHKYGWTDLTCSQCDKTASMFLSSENGSISLCYEHAKMKDCIVYKPSKDKE